MHAGKIVEPVLATTFVMLSTALTMGSYHGVRVSSYAIADCDVFAVACC